MEERKGASYRITQRRGAQDPNNMVSRGRINVGHWTEHARTPAERGDDGESFEDEQRWEAQRDIDRYGL